MNLKLIYVIVLLSVVLQSEYKPPVAKGHVYFTETFESAIDFQDRSDISLDFLRNFLNYEH